jgi:hypothetical protein
MAVHFEVGSDTVCFSPSTSSDDVTGGRAVGEGDMKTRDPAVAFFER